DAPAPAGPAVAPAAAPAPAEVPAQDRSGDSATPEIAEQPPVEQPKDQLDGWIKEAVRVLQANGTPAEALDADAIRTIVEHESGGDPSVVNNWDSNAAAGTPSKGLMQTIEPTFESYALPQHQDILNPVDNIIAGVRYSIDRYGSISNVPGVVGVSSGGSYRGY
ncbi:transglycosylase SLT domain-containing protein, partial [Saccharopolyspora taberi]